MKEQTNKIIAIQGLRGILALMIFIFHSPINGTFSENYGVWGVEVFFVLSGFCSCLSRATENNETSFPHCIKYGIRKAKKLYPLYCVMSIIAIPLIVAKILILKEGSLSGFVFRVIANAFLLDTIIPLEFVKSMSGTGWFLSTIFFCYIAEPKLKKLCANPDSKGLVAILVAVILKFLVTFLILLSPSSYAEVYVYCSPVVRVFDYIIGMNLANICTRNRCALSQRHVLTNILAVISIILIYLFKGSNYYLIELLYVINAICMVLAAYISGGYIQKILSNNLLLRFGNISGYFFLIHFVIIEYFMGLEITDIHINKYFVTIVEFILSITLTELWIWINTKKLRTV